MKKPATKSARLWPCALALSLGCQASAGARVQADLQAFQDEQAADTLLDRGQAFAAVGDTIRAQEYLEAAIEAGGREGDILPLLLSVCARDGRYQLAADYARNYLTQKPDDHRLRFILGTLYLSLGDVEAAEHELRLAADGERDNPDVEYAFGILMRDYKSDPGEAARHFQRYLRLAPRGEHAEEARASLRAELP